MASSWTWLIYMAGDNNLEGDGFSDLEEMKRVGSTEDVNVLVQFDTEKDSAARYRIGRGELETLQTMPGINCGNPDMLSDFLKWGVKNYPADHYLVNIWNHGGGWENLPEGYDYETIRASKPHRAARLMRAKRTVFRSTIEDILSRPAKERAIALDVGSQDYLDNQELRMAFEDSMPDGRKFDIFACDACLMNMVEIAYEMRNTADLMVGSEETEPSDGWPYDAILSKLVAQPEMSPEKLAKLIVVEYGMSYEKSGRSVTQSALDLEKIGAVTESISALGRALVSDIDNVAKEVLWARYMSQKFDMPQYIDLGDLALKISRGDSMSGEIKSAANNVISSLSGGFVLQNVALGRKVEKATGISIYFPFAENYAPEYSDLQFSKDCGWREFLENFFKA